MENLRIKHGWIGAVMLCSLLSWIAQADPNEHPLLSQEDLKDETFVIDASQNPVDQRLERGIPLASGINQHLHELSWNRRIKAPKTGEKNIYRDRLKQLIEQVRSAKLKPRTKQRSTDLPEQTVSSQKPSASEPNDVDVRHHQDISDSQRVSQQAQEAQQKGALSDQTLQSVKAIMEEIPSIKNTKELAETLFAGGYIEEAAIFYRKAYDAMDPNAPTSAAERAWMLFQIGNCLREIQPQQAVQAYHQLGAEHPDSPWSALAGHWQDLAQWYATENPQRLLQEIKVQCFYEDMLDQAQDPPRIETRSEEQAQ